MTSSPRSYMIDDPAIREKIVHNTFTNIPHAAALGLKFVELERNRAVGLLPYRPELVGNINNGAVHTGVLISLIDSISGLAVYCALPKPEAIVTLDLRIDCFKPSTRGMDLYAVAECHKLTNTIAFIRGSIFHESARQPIAGCTGAFFRTGNSMNPQLIDKAMNKSHE